MKTLRQAAQELCDRWDSPLWKDVAPTAVFIGDLRKAIAREEAQTVEPCKGANCGTTNPKLHSAACFAQYESTIGAESPFGYFSFVLDDGDGYWREAEDGEGRPLFTHPAPTATAPVKLPENCGTGHCSCIECVKPAKPSTGEREALITHLRNHSSKLGNEAADMLAADAQWKSRYEQREAEARQLSEQIIKLKAQQVAVPQGWHSLVEKWDKDSSRSTPADAMLINKCIRELSAFITAPQPPQVAELTDLQEREAFNEWRNAFINETGHHPEAVDAWKFRAGLAAQKGKS